MLPAYPSLVCSFNMSNIEGTNLKNACLLCVCIHVCVGTGLQISLRKGSYLYIYHYMREKFQSVHLLATEFGHPEVTLCN